MRTERYYQDGFGWKLETGYSRQPSQPDWLERIFANIDAFCRRLP